MFKEYVAIAVGELDRDSDYIDGAMKMHPHDRLRMIVFERDPDAEALAQLLRGVGTLPGLYAGKGAAAYGPHAPDSGSPAARGLPGAGGQALRRAASQLKLSDIAPDIPLGEGERVDRPAGAPRLPVARRHHANRAMDSKPSAVSTRHAPHTGGAEEAPACSLSCKRLFLLSVLLSVLACRLRCCFWGLRRGLTPPRTDQQKPYAPCDALGLHASRKNANTEKTVSEITSCMIFSCVALNCS